MADPARARKLAVRIRQIVSAAIETQIKDPRLGMVTVTDARVTNDLREATVFYTVYGDETQLTSMFTNLVDNAVKYTPPGGRVEVVGGSESSEITIRISDTGIGIPEGKIPRIFERFYRVDKARSKATGGTGLGLSIVRHVAENHGGRVTVQSTPGEGSTFTVHLPRA